MRRVNILFVILQMEMGGAEQLVRNLIHRLDRSIFNPSIAWFFGRTLLKEFEDLGVSLYHVPKIKRFDFSTMRSLGRIINHNDIHVINAHHFMPMVYSFYGCKVVNTIKLVYTEHSEWEVERIPWTWKKIGSCLLNQVDGTVGVTAEITKCVQEKFNICPSKTFTIQNGVDLRLFSSHADEKSIQKKKLGLANEDKVIGMVANFRKIKNHILLLKAFEELLKEYNNVKLLLIGQGFGDDAENSESEIRNFINNKGLDDNVLFLGFRSDIPDILSVMDVFCLTSFKEGLPISLIEAMAAGLPIVGTDVEGIRDVIIPNKNGFLIRVDDIKGLTNALCTLLRNESLRDEMGRESKYLARRKYSLKRCVTQHQNLFLSITRK